MGVFNPINVVCRFRSSGKKKKGGTKVIEESFTEGTSRDLYQHSGNKNSEKLF